MTKLCICKICNCGRHRCPHRPQSTKGSGVCHLTEYANRYHPHPIDMRSSYKPVQDVTKSDAPCDDKTTHRVDYVKHPLERPYVHHGAEYIKPAGQMEGLTSYNKEFVPKRADKAREAPREHTRKEPGKFDGMPTYKNDYRRWELKPRGLVNSVPAWTAPTGRFEGDTNYRNDYVRYNATVRQSFKPDQVAKQSDAVLDDETIYRKHYVPFELAKREPKARAEWQPNKTPLDALTTFRRDYTPKRGGPADSCKPGNNAYQSDAPFNDDTTMRNDYKRWDVERPHHHEGGAYVAPKGLMDMNTTHNLNYTPKPLERMVLHRPMSRPREQAEFSGNTNYREDYRPWDLSARETFGSKDQYVAPKAAFEGIPTYKAHYIPHRLQPLGNFKPGHAETNSGAFDDNTMYRVEYTQKHLEPCPAASIDNNPTFRFQTEDMTGHRIYALNNGMPTSQQQQQQALAAC